MSRVLQGVFPFARASIAVPLHVPRNFSSQRLFNPVINKSNYCHPRLHFNRPLSACCGPPDGLLPRKVSVPVGGGKVPYDPIYIRDACQCICCVDPSTTQKLFETCDIPLDISVKHLRRLPEGGIEIAWEGDVPGFENHVSRFGERELECDVPASMAEHEHLNLSSSRTWEPANRDVLSNGAEQLTFDYAEYMESDNTLLSALQAVSEFGFAFLQKIPSETFSINRVARRIGPLRNTFYGETWDVRSVASAKNVAYTSDFLGFHMDLLYMENPPGLQILHCMKASTLGGESLFSDSHLALHIIQKSAPELLSPLLTFPVTYRYRNDGQWYQYSRPVIETSANEGGFALSAFGSHKGNAIGPVNWSPPFQGPLKVDIGQGIDSTSGRSCLRQFLLAAKVFKAVIEDQRFQFETKMQEGTCVIFNNRRLLHARRAFTTERGERWLRGAYLDTDVFRSRLSCLQSSGLDRSSKPTSWSQITSRKPSLPDLETILERSRNI